MRSLILFKNTYKFVFMQSAFLPLFETVAGSNN